MPTDPTSLYGAALFVHVSSTTESRITVPAPDPASGRGIGSGFVGNKTVTYSVALGIVYRFAIPNQLPDGMDEAMWVDGLDQITDDLKQGIRAQPTLGADRSVILLNVFRKQGWSIPQRELQRARRWAQALAGSAVAA